MRLVVALLGLAACARPSGFGADPASPPGALLVTGSGWMVESDEAGALLGISVASAGDVNGDGYSDVAVGVPHHLFDPYAGYAGQAFVHQGSAAGLEPTAAWTVEGQFGDDLGDSVASAGDVNGDGYDDLVVGSRYYDDCAYYCNYDTGRVAVYHGSAAGLSPVAARTWYASAPWTSSNFGASATTAGDVNGDGYGDVIVGEPYYDDGADDEGAAHLYLGSAGGVAALPAWSFIGAGGNDQVGSTVASAGDVDGDGYGDVVVASEVSTNSGKVSVFHGSAAGLSSVADVVLLNDVPNGSFGASIASAGDIDGDGYGDLLVGVTGYTNGETAEGRALLYLGSAAGLSTTPAWSVEPDLASAGFGTSVASAGDLDGDGYDDVLVGASGPDQVHVYRGSAAGLATIPADVITVSGDFGASVASAGDTDGDGHDDVLVGAPYYDNGETDEGAAFLYLGTAGDPDADGDGVPDAYDACAGFDDAADADGDGIPDGCEVPALSAVAVLAGGQNTWDLVDAGPGTTWTLVTGKSAGASPVPGCAGLGFGFQVARSVDTRVADAVGSARFAATVPAQAAGRNLAWQAADLASCRVTNVVIVHYP